MMSRLLQLCLALICFRYVLFILAIIQHTVQLCMGCVGLSALYYCAVCWLPVIWIRCDRTISYKGKYVACLYGRKQVSIIRKYHNHTLQTNPRLREKPQNTNNYKTPGRQTMKSNRFSLILIKLFAKLERHR